jgi:hypothetical protein
MILSPKEKHGHIELATDPASMMTALNKFKRMKRMDSWAKTESYPTTRQTLRGVTYLFQKAES